MAAGWVSRPTGLSPRGPQQPPQLRLRWSRTDLCLSRPGCHPPTQSQSRIWAPLPPPSPADFLRTPITRTVCRPPRQLPPHPTPTWSCSKQPRPALDKEGRAHVSTPAGPRPFPGLPARRGPRGSQRQGQLPKLHLWPAAGPCLCHLQAYAHAADRGLRQEEDWFHLVGLLHDLGKVLVLAGEPQWAVVGDTFPVGCRPQASVVFCDSTFQDNPDLQDPRYSTEFGMYQPHCGLENVLMSWGHDEYMYQMMKFNKFSLPPEAFYMIRFHSFYPWHTGGDYRQLCSEQDLAMLPWVQEFNKFDLYTKCPDLPDVDELRPYYQGLIDKYCPGVLSW
uniref:Inositol oxygenase n=1 Tax=Felis catus TaxID=9685 RepID=A0ABI7ZKF0_FELCA